MSDGEPLGYTFEELREADLRLAGWAPYEIAELRNGEFWGLPSITPEVLGAWPELRAYAGKLADFDRFSDIGVLDTRSRDDAVRGIAECLLQANYLLLTWQAEALIPEDRERMDQLAVAVRALVARADAVFMTYAERAATALVMPN